MSRNTRALWWISSCGLVLAFVGVSVFVFLRAFSSSPVPNPSISSTALELELNPSNDVVPTNTIPVSAATVGPRLPPLDFPLGSIEDACGLNDFPPYHYREEDGSRPVNTPFIGGETSSKREWIPLESEECRFALAEHINAINPYLWGATNEHRPFAFVLLAEPLTFERIFADPLRDLVQVQDALSRPECLLENAETNWALKESCHADAFLNFALINRFCFEPHWPAELEQDQYLPRDGTSRRSRTYYREKGILADENPTSEQDRFMWKQDLENAWVRMKCKELDLSLEFTPERYPVLYEKVMSFQDRSGLGKKNVREYMIELSARLGSDAAGLTSSFSKDGWFSYSEEGYKYGRFAEFLSSAEWQSFTRKLEPSTDYFLKTFFLLASLDSQRGDSDDTIQFDWEFVVQHMCMSPFFKYSWSRRVPLENVEHNSCQEIIHEIRQKGIGYPSLLDTLSKFEQVALRLGVYE